MIGYYGRTLIALGAVLTAGALSAQESRSYSPVTDARLESPEARNWLMYLREYSSWSYSPLDRINTRNVANLAPVWTMSTGTAEGHQAPPIVNDGVMFVTTPFNQVLAIDAKTGDLLWRYRHQMPADIRMGHPTNRGVALYGDKVYTATSDARVVALDAKTGQVVWNKAVENYNNGYYMTIAPFAARGRIMVGVSGGERGIRGFVVALDANTGEQIWKTYTVPAPGEPGNDTWPGDSWRTGGAPVWVTGSFDPKLGLTYWGTGNPGPWTGDARPGDNLYTNSVVALDVETGALKGYHQYHWNDSWDWDEVAAPLADRLAAQRPHGAGPRARRPQRLSLDAREERDRHLVHRREAVREAERLHEHRSRHGPARVRHGAQARHRQAGHLLPVAVGRQGLAAGGLQPGHGLSLHPGQRESLPAPRRRGRRVPARPAIHGRADRRFPRRRRRHPHRRAASLEPAHGRTRVDARIRVAELGPRHDDRRRARVQRRHQRSLLPRVRRGLRQAARGNTARTPASPACRPRSRSTACSTSPCNRAGASTRKA